MIRIILCVLVSETCCRMCIQTRPLFEHRQWLHVRSQPNGSQQTRQNLSVRPQTLPTLLWECDVTRVWCTCASVQKHATKVSFRQAGLRLWGKPFFLLLFPLFLFEVSTTCIYLVIRYFSGIVGRNAGAHAGQEHSGESFPLASWRGHESRWGIQTPTTNDTGAIQVDYVVWIIM